MAASAGDNETDWQSEYTKMFLEKLTILNHTFLNVIERHVKNAPDADLTPTVLDYVKHVNELDKIYGGKGKHASSISSNDKKEKETSTSVPKGASTSNATTANKVIVNFTSSGEQISNNTLTSLQKDSSVNSATTSKAASTTIAAVIAPKTSFSFPVSKPSEEDERGDQGRRGRKRAKRGGPEGADDEVIVEQHKMQASTGSFSSSYTDTSKSLLQKGASLFSNRNDEQKTPESAFTKSFFKGSAENKDSSTSGGFISLRDSSSNSTSLVFGKQNGESSGNVLKGETPIFAFNRGNGEKEKATCGTGKSSELNGSTTVETFAKISEGNTNNTSFSFTTKAGENIKSGPDSSFPTNISTNEKKNPVLSFSSKTAEKPSSFSFFSPDGTAKELEKKDTSQTPPVSTSNESKPTNGGSSANVDACNTPKLPLFAASADSSKVMFAFGKPPTTAANSAQSKDSSDSNEKKASAPKPLLNFSFGAPPTKSSETKEGEAEDSGEYVPPKVEAVIQEEPDAVLSSKCSVFILKGSGYEKMGIGQLHIKKIAVNAKKILLIRAATTIGTIWVNAFVNDTMKVSKVDDTKLRVTCVSEGTPSAYLIRLPSSKDRESVEKELSTEKN